LFVFLHCKREVTRIHMKFMSSENEILFTRLSAKKVMNSLIEIAMRELLNSFDEIYVVETIPLKRS